MARDHGLRSPLRAVALVSSALVLASCAASHGFDRGALSREARSSTPLATDEDIAKALGARAQLGVPFSVAVYFRPVRAEDRWRVGHENRWVWSSDDKQAVLARIDSLVPSGSISKVIPIADEVAAGDDLKSIRHAAARYGADAVIVVRGAGQVDRYNNVGSALYWTIVGLFLVPGTSADALFVASATMWDVRNEYLYASAEVEGREQVIGTPFTVDDGRTLAAPRSTGMIALGEEVERRLRTLAGTITAAK